MNSGLLHFWLTWSESLLCEGVYPIRGGEEVPGAGGASSQRSPGRGKDIGIHIYSSSPTVPPEPDLPQASELPATLTEYCFMTEGVQIVQADEARLAVSFPTGATLLSYV